MDQIIALVRQVFDLFRFWVIIAPWEQAVRVRLGRRVAVLGAGVHFRIPVVDAYYVQSTRMRQCTTGRQTVTTRDGKVATVTATVGYAIMDVLLLHNTLHHAEDTIVSLVRGLIASVVSSSDSGAMTSGSIADKATANLDLTCYGLSDASVLINEFAVSRAYRFIGDYAQSYLLGSSLTTEKSTEAR